MKLIIEGMHCQKCVERVRKAIDKVDGARAENVAVGSATIAVDSTRGVQVLAAIRDAGYAARETA
jgi:copper chaperone CopZ